MKGSVGTPAFWPTLKGALGDGWAVARQAPGLTAFTVAMYSAEFLAYETVSAELASGLQTALLSVADTVAIGALVAALTIATYRWVLLNERSGFAVLVDKVDILTNFIAVSTAISLLVWLPVLVIADVHLEEAPVLVSASFVASLVLLVLSVRLAFLEPAIATRSVLATVGASWRLTRGVSWRLIGAIATLILPPMLVLVALAVLEVDGQTSPVTYALLSGTIGTILVLTGSAVVARYYVWRRDQG